MFFVFDVAIPVGLKKQFNGYKLASYEGFFVVLF
jgi:hypothetical protein